MAQATRLVPGCGWAIGRRRSGVGRQNRHDGRCPAQRPDAHGQRRPGADEDDERQRFGGAQNIPTSGDAQVYGRHRQGVVDHMPNHRRVETVGPVDEGGVEETQKKEGRKLPRVEVGGGEQQCRANDGRHRSMVIAQTGKHKPAEEGLFAQGGDEDDGDGDNQRRRYRRHLQ